jgi:hypothetical protein
MCLPFGRQVEMTQAVNMPASLAHQTPQGTDLRGILHFFVKCVVSRCQSLNIERI